MFKRNINSVHGAGSRGIVRWFHGTKAGGIQHQPHKTGQPCRPAQPQGIMCGTPSAAEPAPRLPVITKIRNQPLTEPDRWTKDQAGNCVGQADGVRRDKVEKPFRTDNSRANPERVRRRCEPGASPAPETLAERAAAPIPTGSLLACLPATQPTQRRHRWRRCGGRLS